GFPFRKYALMPPPQVAKRDVYGVFAGVIETDSVQRIVAQLTKLTHPGAMVDCIHFMLHSPGGQVPDGIALHNFFRNFTLKLILYNGGNVSSAAVIAFLGAKERRASVYAMFGIHRCSLELEHGYPATDLQHLVNTMLAEDERTEAIFRRAGLKLTDAQWADFANNKDLMFTAKDVVEMGFVQEIAEFSPPAGTVLFTV
ncbi:MAG: ATP-dependent Clp protease proteolytic subunit, partial [Candidatus Korobacteraceae bacterium]